MLPAALHLGRAVLLYTLLWSLLGLHSHALRTTSCCSSCSCCGCCWCCWLHYPALRAASISTTCCCSCGQETSCLGGLRLQAELQMTRAN